MTTPSQTVAGHPIAMKVGGRRLSISKSPSAKSHLSTSPNATKDAAAPTPGDKPATDKADAKAGGDTYPRPNGISGEDGAVKKDDTHKEEAKKDEQQQNKKDKAKQQFEDSKPQHHNKNPHTVKNVPIKQPGGLQH